MNPSDTWLRHSMHRCIYVHTALFALGCLLLGSVGAASLYRPQGLEPDVAFWRRIFAEVTTDQGVVHDNRDLAIVYETINLQNGSDSALVRRIAEQARLKYAGILRQLAQSSRTDLDAEQARVLALWPPGVSNDELLAAVDRIRFQQGLADRFHAGLIRAGRWREHIRATMREAGVPEELAALPHVESSFDPSARSYVGAAGLWQFTDSTGRRFLEIDRAVDERRDPFRSSEAAAHLLKYNYSILGTWPLAITAYNHGVGGMRRAVQTMGTDDIEVILRNYTGPAFGFASRNFYVSFLAAYDVERNSEKYFGPLERDKPSEDAVATIPDFVRVSTLERALGVSRSRLQEYNPALLPAVWDGAKYVPRGFQLRVPALALRVPLHDALASIPKGQRSNTQAPDRFYRTRRGDTWQRLAARFHLPIDELMTENGVHDQRRLRSGEKLRLPGPPLREESVTPLMSAAAGEKSDTYVVRSGESLAHIASQTGLSETQLLAANGLRDRHSIYPGQKLRLSQAPEKAVSSPSSRPIAPPASLAEGPKPATVVAVSAAESTQSSEHATATSLADPVDYQVGKDSTIEVQATETLSHYAEWLNVDAQRLRQINHLTGHAGLVVGHRIKLAFDHVDRQTFFARRMAHHRQLQEGFFAHYRITDTVEIQLRPGESLWTINQRQYKVPLWLLRQYNPDLDMEKVRPGTRVIFPRLEDVAASTHRVLAGLS